MCTGFNMFHYQDSKIIGRDGYSVQDEWDAGVPYANNGCQIPKMPNYIMILGPQSVSASLPKIIEQFLTLLQYTDLSLFILILFWNFILKTCKFKGQVHGAGSVYYGEFQAELALRSIKHTLENGYQSFELKKGLLEKHIKGIVLRVIGLTFFVRI